MTVAGVTIRVGGRGLLLPRKAFQALQNIMDANEDGHVEDEWKGKTVKHHTEHALGHLTQINRDGHAEDWAVKEDHLAHAFTRLAMAMAVREGWR